MKLFFLLWILPVTLGDTHITCIYSEECMLPCTSTHLDIIHWYLDKKAVHSYYNNQDQLGYQHKDYKGRTSLFSQPEIKNGNVSLLIRNISVQDEGRYRCYAADDRTNDEKYVVVAVEAPAKAVDIRLKDDTVICTTNGVYPEPKVLWSSDPPAVQRPLNTFSQTEDHLFTVTSQLKVDVISNTDTYNCSITTKNARYTATLKQQASEVKNEFIFKCPVPKDFDYTLTLRSSTNILTYDSKTSMKEISEQWRNKVTFHPENGTIILSDLNQEQMGTYTCESTTAHNRYITQAKIQSSGGGIAFILVGIIAAIIIIIIAASGFIVIRRKLSKKSKDTSSTKKTSKPAKEQELQQLNGTTQ
ncbi:HERV-H LTR-associating protein 2 isoform X2 [Labeo rohita]|uniref:HERV-H LTR-associating protein 2 isoform X2 n=1 Tax=Labeo rohita TaxID=84645 RepID=UPI0021E33B91|nr:HERV-H LTR-associating protein 2 isoform X2 [Labeo rohita]